MTMGDFAFTFGQIVDGLRDHTDDEKFAFFKDNFDEKKGNIKKRLRADDNIFKKHREETQ